MNDATDRPARPPPTTLTSFFAVFQADNFARTLLHADIPRYYTRNALLKSFQHRKQGMLLFAVVIGECS